MLHVVFILKRQANLLLDVTAGNTVYLYLFFLHTDIKSYSASADT